MDAHSKKHIDDLYQTKICEDYSEDIEKKKFIVNKNLGLLEKKYNSASITKIYQSLVEAQYYQIKYGGYIYKVTDQKFVEVDPTEKEAEDGVICKGEHKDGRKLYVLINNVKKALERKSSIIFTVSSNPYLFNNKQTAYVHACCKSSGISSNSFIFSPLNVIPFRVNL